MDTRHPILRPWIRSAEVRGECRYEKWNTTTKTECVNEVAQPLKWTPRVQSGVFLRQFGHL